MCFLVKNDKPLIMKHFHIWQSTNSSYAKHKIIEWAKKGYAFPITPSGMKAFNERHKYEVDKRIDAVDHYRPPWYCLSTANLYVNADDEDESNADDK